MKKSQPVATLSAHEARAEHARLGEEIAAHDRRYYQDDAPTISDADYDALRRRYEALEAAFPELATTESLTPQGRRGAGGKIRQGETRRADALARQCVLRGGSPRIRRARAALSRPCRGRAARLHRGAEDRRPLLFAALRKGPARQAATRGDGFEGEDVTANIRTIGDIPHRLQGERARGARGARRGLHGARGFRRAQRAPGSARTSRSSPIRATPPPARCASSTRAITAARPLRFFAYAWGEASELPAKTQMGVIEAFARFGLPVNPLTTLCARRRGNAGALPRHRSRSARRSATTSTASSTRSTTSVCRSGSASSRARRAGRSRINFPPNARRRSCGTSRSRSAAPAR